MDYKQRIIEEAAGMFRTYGIRSVTMDMLANQMSISKRTIYEIFHDKDELLKGVLIWMGDRQSELMNKILDESDNVIEAIFKIIDRMMDHFQNMSPAFQMDIKRFHHELFMNLDKKDEMPYYKNNTEIIKRGMKEGVFREDINIEIINKWMFEVVKLVNDRELFPPEDFLSKDVVQNVFINFLRGISTQKGLGLINFYEKGK
jgi:AcrR family transcriptional regulator